MRISIFVVVVIICDVICELRGEGECKQKGEICVQESARERDRERDRERG